MGATPLWPNIGPMPYINYRTPKSMYFACTFSALEIGDVSLILSPPEALNDKMTASADAAGLHKPNLCVCFQQSSLNVGMASSHCVEKKHTTIFPLISQ